MAGDPLWINASAGAPAYSANELRQAHVLPLQYNGRVFGGRAGVRPGGNALQTSIAGSTITVRAGVACVDPGLTTTQGSYWVALPADETHSLTAAAGQPRKDITVLRVYDHDEDSSGLRTARSEYIAGTPAGSPSEPAVPSGAMKLSTIDVPASGGGSPVVTMNFAWTVATGGILPVRNQAERDTLSPYDGFAVYRQDRDWVEIYDGAALRVQGVAIVSSGGDLAAITNPYNGLQAFNTGVNAMLQLRSAVWHLAAPISYDQPTQTGSGALGATATATIATVSIPDLGVPYKIEAWAQLATTTPAAGNPSSIQVTYDSTTWDTNRIGLTHAGIGPVVGIDTVLTLPARQSIQVSGAKTVRLLCKAGANPITVGTGNYCFGVRAVPAVP